ncbi:MAG: porin, partial [Myxococcales bacterium]|nr:porin [Myxococcales bacterium]
LSGKWGTLIYGIWDTPWKWSTLIVINPIYGGFIPDYTSIISTPGFGVGALNTALGFAAGSASNAAFYRREANSIQYWSPTIAGFSARLAYVIDEGRNTGGGMAMAPGTDPYILSGYVGYDTPGPQTTWHGDGLRVRYAYELHHDFFGMAQLGGTSPAPSAAVTSSNDMGHQAIVQYTIVPTPDVRTRMLVTGEFLSYQDQDRTSGAIHAYSRPAFYALVEQSFSQHHIWAAYGQAFEGTCERVGGGDCSTKGLGAKSATLGYLFALNDTTNIHLVGYRIFNDSSARYVTFLPVSTNPPGAGSFGVGLGFIYTFSIPLVHPSATD